MIYNKPRDIKLRTFPSLSSLVDNIPKPSRLFGKGKSTDNLTQNQNAVLQSNTADFPLPKRQKNIFSNKTDFVQDADKDFDIILKPETDEDIFDLTEMPVIEGIPILILPDENIPAPRKAEPTRTAPNKDIQQPTATPKKIVVEVVQEDDVFDLSDMPDIEGIPLLPLKPVETEHIEPLQDFTYTSEDTGVIVESAEQQQSENKASFVEQANITETAESLTVPEEKLPTEEPVSLKQEKEQKHVKDEAEKTRLAREKAEKAEALKREKKEKADALRKEKEEKARLKAQEKQAQKDEKLKTTELKKAKRQQKHQEKAQALKAIPRLSKAKIAVFFITFYLVTILAFIMPLRPTYSETEKRNLTKFPEFTLQAFISGDYFSDISTWFSDTFPFRETLTRINTTINALYGFDTVSVHGDVEAGDEIPDAPLNVEAEDKPEKKPDKKPEDVTMPDEDDLSSDNGDPNAKKPDIEVQSMNAIVVAGDSAYEYYSFAQDIAPRLISCIDNIDGIVKPKGKVYAMIIPTSMDITLNDAIRSEVSSANQEKALNYFNASFKNAIAVDGIYNAERDHRDEYIYFRTDHHWTAKGAYYAYEQFTLEKGIDAVPLKDYKTKKFENFIGTFYSSSGQDPALKENPDHVTAYLPFNDVTCTITEYNGADPFEWEIINDVTDYDAGGKYLTFIGGDNALTTIVNNDIEDGETCIVIKESYGNAFVPFLIPHYKKIYVIDPRHYNGTLTDFRVRKSIDDVIFLCNISATRNYIFLEGLENLVR